MVSNKTIIKMCEKLLKSMPKRVGKVSETGEAIPITNRLTVVKLYHHKNMIQTEIRLIFLFESINIAYLYVFNEVNLGC